MILECCLFNLFYSFYLFIGREDWSLYLDRDSKVCACVLVCVCFMSAVGQSTKCVCVCGVEKMGLCFECLSIFD